jgi:Zn-dependent M16 (insulinase) family peptidase
MASLFMILFFQLVQVQGLTFQNILQALSPDNTYGVDSGGDPNEIPKLTFEEFKVCYQSGSKFWILTY